MGKTRRALVLLNSGLGDVARVRRLGRGCLVLCADNGLRHARRLGLRPAFVVGDMDSLPRRLPNRPPCVFLCDFDEDRSDFRKTLDLARALGAREVLVAGSLGGRLDQQLANFAVAESMAARMRIAFIDEGWASPAGPGLHRLDCRPGQLVSILPATLRARVSTRGLAYALKRSLLERGSRGLSNRALSRAVRVRVHSGLVWLVCSAGG